MKTVYDFTVKDRKGKDVSLKEYANEVLLIVNTATKCGFTPQYTRKVFIFLLFLTFCISEGFSNPEKKFFEYPFRQGSVEWYKFTNPKDRIAALQIPTDVFDSIPTTELLDICFDFQYITDLFTCNSLDEGYNCLETEFNGFKAILKRNDIDVVLLNKLEAFTKNPRMGRTLTENNARISIRYFLIGYLLGKHEILNNMSEEQKERLKNYLELFLKSDSSDTRILSSQAFKQLYDALITEDQATQINRYLSTVYTPKGNSVVVSIRPEYLSQEEKELFAYDAIHNYDAIIVAEATSTYNCHAYAWHMYEGHSNDSVWMNDPSLYWIDGSYSEIESESSSEKIVYSGNHSAIRINSTTYESKWGTFPLVRHHPDNVPTIYLPYEQKKYYKHDFSILGPLHLCNQESYSIAINASIQWRVSNPNISIINGQGTNNVTLQNTGSYCKFTLYADIYADGSLVTTISKNITAGTPIMLGMNVLPVHRNGTTYVNGWQENSAGNGIVIENIDPSYYSSLEATLTNISNPSVPVPVAHYTNLIPSTSFISIPASCGAGFYELKVRGVNQCGETLWTTIVIEIRFNGGGGVGSLELHYNPSTETVKAILPDMPVDKLYAIQLWNTTTLLKTINVDNGQRNSLISVTGLSKGVYIVRATANGNEYIGKFYKY